MRRPLDISGGEHIRITGITMHNLHEEWSFVASYQET